MENVKKKNDVNDGRCVLTFVRSDFIFELELMKNSEK